MLIDAILLFFYFLIFFNLNKQRKKTEQKHKLLLEDFKKIKFALFELRLKLEQGENISYQNLLFELHSRSKARNLKLHALRTHQIKWLTVFKLSFRKWIKLYLEEHLPQKDLLKLLEQEYHLILKYLELKISKVHQLNRWFLGLLFFSICSFLIQNLAWQLNSEPIAKIELISIEILLLSLPIFVAVLFYRVFLWIQNLMDQIYLGKLELAWMGPIAELQRLQLAQDRLKEGYFFSQKHYLELIKKSRFPGTNLQKLIHPTEINASLISSILAKNGAKVAPLRLLQKEILNSFESEIEQHRSSQSPYEQNTFGIGVGLALSYFILCQATLLFIFLKPLLP